MVSTAVTAIFRHVEGDIVGDVILSLSLHIDNICPPSVIDQSYH